MTQTFLATATAFFADLEKNNTRSFWDAHRATYDRDIRPPFEELVTNIRGYPQWRIYRPHNDTRFQSNKGPYKTFIGAVAERADGVGAFIQISARGLLIGTGLPMPAPDQLPKLRSEIAAEDSGAAFVAAMTRVRETGATVHGGRWEPLKRVPKPYDQTHPRGEYLCWRGVEVNYRLPSVAWKAPAEGSDAIARHIDEAEPLHAWLAAHVGPSLMTPEERFAPKKRP